MCKVITLAQNLLTPDYVAIFLCQRIKRIFV